MARKHLFTSAIILLVAACASETKRTVIVENDAPVEEVVDFGGETNRQPTTEPVKETCQAQSQVATPVPLHLVVVLDASGSMRARYDEATGASINRLDAIKNALINYSKAPQPTPVWMSIVPYGLNRPLKGGTGEECAAPFYVPLPRDTRLPNVGVFQNALAELAPQGLTPTGGAVLGSIVYARKLRIAYPKDNIALIVATDGDPSGCSGPANVNTALAAGLREGYPTFMIGVGDEEISALNGMAVSGGTGTPLLIDGVSAVVVTQKMNRKFEEIRSAFSCELQLPTTFPNGTPTDKSQINVQITSGEGIKSELVYSQDCTKPNAFKYDDVASPTKVLLCEDTCTMVKADRKVKQDLLMGCPSKVN